MIFKKQMLVMFIIAVGATVLSGLMGGNIEHLLAGGTVEQIAPELFWLLYNIAGLTLLSYIIIKTAKKWLASDPVENKASAGKTKKK